MREVFDTQQDEVLGWHFLAANRRLRWGSGALVEDGTTVFVEGALYLCRRGLHACRRIIDALTYAPGAILCRVCVHGTVLIGDDKLCASHRTVLWSIDARQLLRRFARQCAVDVLPLWDAPSEVRQWLEVGGTFPSAAEAGIVKAVVAGPPLKTKAARVVLRAAMGWDANAAARDAAWNSSNLMASPAAHQEHQERVLRDLARRARRGETL